MIATNPDNLSDKAILNGLTLWEAIFSFGSPALVESAQMGQQAVKAPEMKNMGFWDIIGAAGSTIVQLQHNHGRQAEIIKELKSEILGLIKKADLMAFGYKEPREIDDAPIKIPPDLFLNGEINWNNSELKNRNFEFSAIRIFSNNHFMAPEKLNADKKEIKIKNNFSEIEPDRHIDEKRAAEYLGISYKTLQGYRVKGGGPEFVKIGKKTVRYKFSDLQKWTENKKKKNTSQN